MEHEEEIDSDWTAKELSVLRSAEQDVPPRGSLERTLTAIGIGAAIGASVGTVATVGSAAKLGGVARWSVGFKWLTASLAGVGLASALYLSRHHSPPRAANATPEKSVLASAAVDSASVPAATEAPAAVAVAESAAAPSSAPAARGVASARSSDKDALAAEIRIIDEARARLRRGDAQGSLAALAQYDQLVGRGGSMRAEATVVRIEALQASGDSARATALGERFIAKNPSSPYVDYVKRVLARSN
ncbi:MAG TPA: hypothetical protein VHV51_18890 [Polyangiaceae bacterium]|jgi:hypothetical protein|nr:hypothetical protein [Polyangiaceae bacterium]